MESLQKIQTFFATLSKKEFQQYTAIAGSLLALLIMFSVYRYTVTISRLKKEIAAINKQRGDQLKELLMRYELVKKQQAEVETMLAKDPNFKIKEFLDTVMSKVNIIQYKAKEEQFSQQDLENGYTENQLYVSFANITTQHICELLYALEQNERVYIKQVELYKTDLSKTINANVTVATLQPKQETSGE
jgi:predicted lipid-binding transport protein (Tim44 family)